MTEPDPRLWLDNDLRVRAGFEAMKVEAGLEAERLLAERLAAGEPVAADYRDVVGGHHGLPRDLVPEHWPTRGRFTVHPDDTITTKGLS